MQPNMSADKSVPSVAATNAPQSKDQTKPLHKASCFVIMPFSETTPVHTEDYWTKHFEDFLKPTIEQTPGVAAHRSAALRADLVTQIITDLVKSDIVVADLTDKNPNVLWELGVRQSFKSGTVTIAEKGTILPFDVYSKSTRFYDLKDVRVMEDFGRDFPQALQDCLDSPHECDSRVLEVIGGRGTLFEIVRREENIRKLDAVESECVYNAALLDTIVENAKHNIRLRKGDPIKMTTYRFALSAIELLVVSRYIEADKSFFELALSYMSLADAINGEISRWEWTEKKVTENWLLKLSDAMETHLHELHAKVVAARQGILDAY
jgi:hypothetical protein